MSSERAYFLPSNNTATVFLVIASILLIYVINCLLYILYYIFDHLISLSLLYLCPTMKPLTGCQVSQVVRRPPRDQKIQGSGCVSALRGSNPLPGAFCFQN